MDKLEKVNGGYASDELYPGVKIHREGKYDDKVYVLDLEAKSINMGNVKEEDNSVKINLESAPGDIKF